jgi:hypothetical protein
MRIEFSSLASLLLLSGCDFAIGAGTAAVVVGAGALARGCYDHVDVTVRDDVTGEVVCDARVVAVEGDSEVELMPCYGVPLGAGRWEIRAERGGRVASSTLVVAEERECGRIVHRLDMTPRPPGQAAPPPAPIQPEAPEPPPLSEPPPPPADVAI